MKKERKTGKSKEEDEPYPIIGKLLGQDNAKLNNHTTNQTLGVVFSSPKRKRKKKALLARPCFAGVVFS